MKPALAVTSKKLWKIFNSESTLTVAELEPSIASGLAEGLLRTDEVLTHPVFNTHHSETENVALSTNAGR